MAKSTPFNNCIVVSKTGALKEIYLIDTELNKEHYKKACSTPPTYDKSFKQQAAWHVKKYSRSVELWARTDGRAGQENKYEFPPPVDELLFFGDCLLVSRAPFTAVLWKKIHAHLFGGFDDLTQSADNDDAESDELENVPEKKKTRHGYLKDGFIVDDSSAVTTASRALTKIKARSNLKISSESDATIEKSSHQHHHHCSSNGNSVVNIGPDEIVINNESDSETSSSSSEISANSSEDDDDDDGECECDAGDIDADDAALEVVEDECGEDNGCDEVDAAGVATTVTDKTLPTLSGDNAGNTVSLKLEQTKHAKPKKISKPKTKIVNNRNNSRIKGLSSLSSLSPSSSSASQIKKRIAVASVSSDHDTASELDEDAYV